MKTLGVLAQLVEQTVLEHWSNSCGCENTSIGRVYVVCVRVCQASKSQRVPVQQESEVCQKLWVVLFSLSLMQLIQGGFS